MPVLSGATGVVRVEGLEPTASCVSGKRSNLVSYTPAEDGGLDPQRLSAQPGSSRRQPELLHLPERKAEALIPSGSRRPAGFEPAPARAGSLSNIVAAVQVIGDSSEEKMVVAFLSAEWDSPRFGADVRYLLGDEELVRNPDLTDAAANQRRRSVLARYRGWRRNVALFEGFPRDVHWKLLEITMHDLDGFLYCNYPDWVNLSGGSRLVRDGAASAGRKPLNETKEHIRAVEREIRRGVTYPPIVAVAEGEAAVHIC